MKKSIILALSIACILLSLTACNGISLPNFTGDSSPLSSDSQPLTADEEAAELSGYTELLDEIKGLPQDFADRSIEVLRTAVDIVNWVETYPVPKDTLLKASKAYLSKLNGEELAAFAKNYDEVDSASRKLVDGSQNVLSLISELNLDLKFKAYSPELFENFSAANRVLLAGNA
ncbi:MAG: hypothetical protein LBS74_03470 [Oscillospiraceae bacterium]|jgi:hypothetical protein|nr:hypothetical protein [Oscillospiraceae bacterium]